MGALSTGLTLLACLPVWLSAGGLFSEDQAFAPYDLRIGSDYFLGAAPIEPEKWITSADHPESTYRRSESGEVSIAFDIAENGRVLNCRVTSESGNSRFDSVPCELLTRRARFKPQQEAKVILPGAHGRMRFRFDEAN
ncbi:MAG: energy transducer TonB [Blastomonas fulva]|uniref:energy transducer TonB family protein n=1 Tax=Blastomonas fulva TaxID=1550728 RepID=UPI0024E1B803|nr:energy transducer TonB [Blastomonas fulva]MDK2757099.1 energy transducer TonB [Blastomonas fulva]